MACLPDDTLKNDGQGGLTSNWIAYAYLDHWLSVYKDEWCTYHSAQMHEIGHNLNLQHSGEGNNEYDDQSCMVRIKVYETRFLTNVLLFYPFIFFVLIL